MEDFRPLIRRVETQLNLLGYIPLLGTLTGMLRMGMGWIQSLTGGVLVVVGVVAGICSWILQSKELLTHWRQFAQASAMVSFNGVLNMKRGFVELFPVIGGGSCFFYDKMMGRVQLVPYKKYP